MDAESEPLLLHQILKLNFCGHSCWMSTEKLMRARTSFLAKFALLTHEQRLQLVDAYLDRSDEYYFEHSIKLFEPILRFYGSGKLHRPTDVCEQEFVDELAFWGLDTDLLESCCHTAEISTEPEKSLKNSIKKPAAPVSPLDPERKLKITKRRKLWNMCEGDGSRLSTFLQVLSVAVIFTFIVVLVMGTIQEFRVQKRLAKDDKGDQQIIWVPHPVLMAIEYSCVAWFTMEYFIRLLLAPNKMEFIQQPLNVIDLISIVPFYIELALDHLAGVNATKLKDAKNIILVLRVLRVLRVARILKLSRYSQATLTFGRTLRNSARQLFTILALVLLTMLFFSTMVYYMEEGTPTTPFTSIPAGFWWCIVTMTTVGYGDVVPVTTIGKIAASTAILSGVLVLALPLSIIVENFGQASGGRIRARRLTSQEDST